MKPIRQGEIPLRRRLGVYCTAWCVVYLSVAFIIPCARGLGPGLDSFIWYLLFSWAFPLGLVELVRGSPSDTSDAIPWIVLIWLGYLAHAVLTIRSRRPTGFILLMLALAIVLALNVSGCRNVVGSLH